MTTYWLEPGCTVAHLKRQGRGGQVGGLFGGSAQSLQRGLQYRLEEVADVYCAY